MNVAYFEIGKKKNVVDVKNELEDLQKLVGGYIQAVPLNEKLLLVCDEDAKLKGKSVNAFVISSFGLAEEIAGNFFICGKDENEFVGLTADEIKYVDNFVVGRKL